MKKSVCKKNEIEQQNRNETKNENEKKKLQKHIKRQLGTGDEMQNDTGGRQTDRAQLRLRTEPVPVSGADRSVGSADRVVLPMEMRHLLPNANATTR